MEAEVVGRMAADRRRPQRCIEAGSRAVRLIVAPGVVVALQPTARRAFPLGFGGQAIALPLAKSLGVGPIDVVDREILSTFGHYATEPVVGRTVSSRLDEPLVLGLSHLARVHVESIEADRMYRAIISQDQRPHAPFVVLGFKGTSHRELTRRYQHHAVGGIELGRLAAEQSNGGDTKKQCGAE